MADMKLGDKFKFPSEALKKHFIALGGSGSGKTVLCKVIVEEAASLGLPCLLVDPQGDLASLAIGGKLNVKIFTPTSSKGIPICINPLKLPGKNVDEEDVVALLHETSNSLCQLLGYKLETDKGKTAQSALYSLLKNARENNSQIGNIDGFAEMVENLDESVRHEVEISDIELKQLSKKIKLLTTGGRELLFQLGMPLDVSLLLKKNQVTVIYLNTLKSQQEKHFFLSTLTNQLYQWMLGNPSEKLQALFYIDEIAEYIPAGQKTPITKEILKLIFKQARKYGVGCIASTQNPGDIDYKAFAQFSTWALGRITTKQDIKKIEAALKSMGDVKCLEMKLPKLKPGEFLMFSPDVLKKIEEFKVRWLVTEHKTLSQEDLKQVVKSEDKGEFEKYAPARVEKVNKPSGEEHFPLNVNDEEINKIIEKSKKKKVLFFGVDENLESFKLVYRPVFEVKVREVVKGLFKKKIIDSMLMFDGITGNLLVCNGDDVKTYFDFIKLFGLEENEIQILKALLENKKEMTAADVGVMLKMTDSYVGKVLNNMMKKKYVSYSGKAGRAYLWQSLLTVRLAKLKKLSSNVQLTSEKIKMEKANVKIGLSQISKVIKAWFNGDVVEDSVVYYPVYEIKFSSKKGGRVVNVSGVSGKAVGV